MVTVTENNSPAKYEACEGVTITRTASSIVVELAIERRGEVSQHPQVLPRTLDATEQTDARDFLLATWFALRLFLVVPTCLRVE